jgi:DNA-binding transcriptional ArsR family regulator
MVVGLRDATGAIDGERTDLLFHALADGTRRDIILRTMDGEHSVSDLARLYPVSFAAVQKHVAVLARAGLVSKERRGRRQLVRAEVDTIAEARRLLEELEAIWRRRAETMAQLLVDDDRTTTRRSTRGEATR